MSLENAPFFRVADFRVNRFGAHGGMQRLLDGANRVLLAVGYIAVCREAIPGGTRLHQLLANSAIKLVTWSAEYAAPGEDNQAQRCADPAIRKVAIHIKQGSLRLFQRILH